MRKNNGNYSNEDFGDVDVYIQMYSFQRTNQRDPIRKAGGFSTIGKVSVSTISPNR